MGRSRGTSGVGGDVALKASGAPSQICQILKYELRAAEITPAKASVKERGLDKKGVTHNGEGLCFFFQCRM